MNYQQLLEQIQDFALSYYKEHDTSRLSYHNLEHTRQVVNAAGKIANHYQLNDHDFFILTAAAWFHDLGYMVDINNHEEKSAEIAVNFLTKNSVDNGIIDGVKGCIAATKMPQSPKNLMEQIICDADLFHLGTDDFFKSDKLLYKEILLLHQPELTKAEWRQKSVTFLKNHQYHTDYCRLLLDDGQQNNLREIEKKVLKDEKKLTESQAITGSTIVEDNDGPVKDLKKDKVKARPEKGIETMFRISSSNHQRLSDMADRKAHIMITVNSIILSAIISLVLRRLSEYGYLLIPSVILLTISVLAMTFSILSTRPTIPAGTFTKDDVDTKKVNLLFFGNFYRMSLDEYNYGMTKMMGDKDFLYGSLIKDLFSQGVVLGRKYRLLRIAYNIFMYGLIVAVLAFIIASAFFGHHPPIK